MANDRQGNAIAAGQVFALAGTVRSIDGDSILIVVGDRGEHAFRCRAGHIVPVDATTAGGGGGGGAPADATYVVQSASGGLSAERVLANSMYIAWNWSTPGQVTAEIDPGVFVYLSAILAPIVHTHDAADIASGVVAAARLGTGTPGSGNYLRGDGVWSSTSAFAAASHTHAASDVTSGTFAAARLGSGSASGTTFLRGDGSWSTIDLTSAAVTGALPISKGGTGATSASAARTALDAAQAAHNHTDLRQIVIDTVHSSGALAGSGITNLGEFLDWFDSNYPPP